MQIINRYKDNVSINPLYAAKDDKYKENKDMHNEYMTRERNRVIEDRNTKIFKRLSKI